MSDNKFQWFFFAYLIFVFVLLRLLYFKNCTHLEYWNVVVNLRAMLLCDTLSNPNNVSAFLFFEF